tara:strand:- start:115 stop:1167 length:1053 start_codon:yes stop_codon:yes gene_type:complete
MAYTTIDDPSVYFQTAKYTGNGGASNAITNDGNSNLQPDWLWIKERSSDSAHTLFDSSRGVDKQIYTNNTDVENSASALNSFNTDGFTVGSDGKTNENSQTYVGWQWKANGGTTASNSSGTITSTVQANTTAGFSIVTYTGNGSSGATIGHGLGAVPDTIIIKARSDTQNWFVNTPVGGGVGYLMLNQTNGDSGANSTVWNSTTPTSTVFTLGNSGGINGNTQTYIAYCFKSIKGYSKIGTYVGNGNDDGPFIYTGFKPAWLMIKRTDTTADWFIMDNTRDDYQNPFADLLSPNLNDAENANTARGDFTSNGFKWRVSPNALNKVDNTYFYMAFAESPFVSSAGVPTTAK